MVRDLPILWSHRRCPYAMRARLAIKSSRVAVRLREIIFRNKPDAFLSVSPDGTVPLIVLADGAIIEESLDIMRWALNINDPESWLDYDLCFAEEFIRELDSDFKTHLDIYKYANRNDNDEWQKHQKKGAKFLQAVDEGLQNNDYLSGDQFGFLDAAALPFIRQFRNTDAVWFDAQNWQNLHPWLQDFMASPRFAAIMEKYTPWDEGNEVSF